MCDCCDDGECQVWPSAALDTDAVRAALADERTRQETSAEIRYWRSEVQRARRVAHMSAAYWRNCYEARGGDLADRIEENDELRRDVRRLTDELAEMRTQRDTAGSLLASTEAAHRETHARLVAEEAWNGKQHTELQAAYQSIAFHRQAATRWTNHAGVVTEQLTKALELLDEVARLGSLWPAQQLRVLKIRAAMTELYQDNETTTTNDHTIKEGGDGAA